MSWRVGVDIGGTFTDVALANTAGGRPAVVKVPTTPRDFGRGVVEALTTALRAEAVTPDTVSLLAHATTVVTNALLEKKGVRTALVTTRGFRDVLEIRRGARARLYDLFQDPPDVLVPRHLRLEVTERVSAEGLVVRPLALDEVDAAVEVLRRHDVQAVAVCLLHAFLNDAHERAIGERLRAALPGVPVFLSSEVLPEIREFERTSTTTVCAYVGPILASYLERLAAATADLGLPRLHVMGSSGGMLTVDEAISMPAMAVESGPAAGVIAAALVGRQLGLKDLISFDMGGTTAKASLIEGGAIKTTSDYEVGGTGSVSRWVHGTGQPIRVPVIDLAEVSAGGGSVAWIDPGGALRVGPESTGAEPGPACYGQGGTRATVTDADLVLGYLDQEALLGGALPVSVERARQAIQEHVGRPLDLDLTAAAAAIVEVVNANMAAALRVVSVERGHDPREFALVAFGGAGPVHAARLAEELDIPTVVIPPIPGGFSALGLVAGDFRRDYARTFYTPLATADVERLAMAYEAMEGPARAMLAETGLAADRWHLARSADLRYPQQAYELTVPLGAGPVTPASLDRLAQDFHDRHRMTYGHASPDEPVQLVNVRLSAIGRLDRLELSAHGSLAPTAVPPPRTRQAYFRETGLAPCEVVPRDSVVAGADRLELSAHGSLAPTAVLPPRTRHAYFRETGLAPCEVVPRDRIVTGADRSGPLIVESMDSTIVVPPTWRLRCDAAGFMILTRRAP